MTLRPYQSDQVRLIRESFSKGHKCIVLASPTGSGKSLVMAEMCRLAFEKGSRVLLLTHRMELFRSTLAHLGRSGIPCVSLEAGSPMPAGDWKVMLAMERTIWNRIQNSKLDSTGEEKFYNGVNHEGYDLSPAHPPLLVPDLIIADEIHFNNFTKIIDHFSAARLIGFSATPQGKHIHKIYTDIVQNIDVPELIQQGWLVPCRAYQMQDNFDDVKISKGEFEDASLFQHFDKAKLYAGIIDEYNRHVKGKKGIIFCCNIKHVENTYQIFKEAGVNAFKVHSEMSDDERRYNVKEFESSNDGVMINNGILTTGFDCPSIMFVILYRATTSLPLFLQMIGRGSRPHSGKTTFIVLDFGQNHTRHGLWSSPRTWSLDPPKKRGKIQPAPVRTCEGCGAMLPANQYKCEFCGLEKPKVERELRDGIMVECDTNCPTVLKGKRVSECSIDDLILLQQTKKLKASYIWRVLRSRGEAELRAYADKKGYQDGWYFNQIKERTAGNIGAKDYILK